MKQLIIVVPVYKSTLDIDELLALDSMYNLLSERYPIALLAPENLDCTSITGRYPLMIIKRMPAHHFISIESYNSMMLQMEVYQLFDQYEYILIYQTDCFIFDESISSFLCLDYDYIGAPWLPKPKYRKWHNKLWLNIQKFIFSLCPQRQRLRHDIYYKVGNGGLCLRRVKAMLKAVENQEAITRWMADNRDIKNEDVYFSLFSPTLKIAPFNVALQFAFDTQPQLAYQMSHNKLPMGCHAWNRENNWNFWKSHIHCDFKAKPKKIT